MLNFATVVQAYKYNGENGAQLPEVFIAFMLGMYMSFCLKRWWMSALSSSLHSRCCAYRSLHRSLPGSLYATPVKKKPSRVS